jgi:uncharacterized protein YecA (UPF0149 family)
LDLLAAKEASADIEEAYRRGLVDTEMIGLEDIKRSIAKDQARIREELDRCQPTGIEDTIEELRHWAAFQKEPPKRLPAPPAPYFATAPNPADDVTATVERHGPRTGRNDPCPCGSGKKFKKCCGARH